VNAVLPAQNTSFEEARADLEAELSVARAVRAIEARAHDLDDQLAGGATLEQLATETEMELGTIAWHPEASEGLAGYPDFRQAAARLAAGDFPKIEQLEDGAIYAMRLDEELPARPNPFADAIDDVTAAWEAAQIVTSLSARAQEVIATLATEGSLEAAGLESTQVLGQTRNAFIAGMPDDFMSQVFGMNVGDVKVLPGEADVVIVTLDAITPASEDAQSAALLEQISQQMNQTLAQDLFNIYADDVVRRAGPQIDQRALQAVHVNFP
jgi:peptidyl-prolyl cis-trans isomerase D